MDLDDEELKVTKNKCNYCEVDIYIKVKKYLRSALAPASYIGELQEELENKTGEMYLKFPKRFCPMCGRKLGD